MTPDPIDAFEHISAGYHPDPALSMSLHADAYTDPRWAGVDQRAIFARTWQWLCHVERLREAGAYVTGTVAACRSWPSATRPARYGRSTTCASTGRTSCCPAPGSGAASCARTMPGPST
ncbi:hypothetical protein ACFQ0B_41200 [Nonomuraea thailandensis]